MSDTPTVSSSASLNLSPEVTSRADAMTPEQARAELHAMRNDPNHDFNVPWRDGHLKACETAWALERRAHTPPARTPAPLPDGPSSKELKDKYKLLMADAGGWADGSIQPDELILLDQEIRLREQQELAARPTVRPTAPPISQTFSEQDLARVLPREWMPPQRERFIAAARALQVSPWDAAQLNADVQIAQRSGALDPDREPLDFDTLWGAQAAANIALVNKYLTSLKRHSPEDEAELLQVVIRDANVANRVLALARRDR
jgi:hypothetical protein